MGFSVLLFVVGLTVAWSQTCEYAKYSLTHTMCVPKNATCVPFKTGLTEADIKVIVDTHNDLRNKVATGNAGQPNAADMKQLIWDAELAKIAQKHSENCTMKHDKNEDRRSKKYESVGQNLGMMMSSVPMGSFDFKQHVENWYNEIKDMDPSYVASFPKSPKTGVIGHYTQVVWGNTVSVGCGHTYYFDGKWYTSLLTCNYGPGGNFLTMPIYTQGAACSKCKKGCSKRYSGLCSP